MIYNFIKDNYYTETTTPEGYVTRIRIKENKINQRIENYRYDDIANPDKAKIKPKGPWIKENKMKSIEPQLGLRFYFEESDRGAYQIIDGKLIAIVNGITTDRKENKMTREEANRIMNKAGSVADGLEALGLIKFEEKKSMEDVVTKARMVCPKYEEFIAELDKHGYKIVPK